MNSANVSKVVGASAVAGGTVSSIIGAPLIPVIVASALVGGACCALGVLVTRAKNVTVEGSHRDRKARVNINL